MKNIWKSAMVCGAVLPVAGYAAGSVVVSTPTTFEQYLANNYSLVADMEDGDATDQLDAHVMSDRALEAYHGTRVEPLNPSQVRIVRANPEALQTGYTRLTRVLNNPQKMNENTRMVADAQVAYDCWAIHQQSEQNASHNMYRCEKNFQALINALDTAPAVAAQPVLYDVEYTHDVYFGFDSADLTPEMRTRLDEIKQKLAANNNQPNGQAKRIALQGFADRSGPATYNQALSERRVRAVASYLGITPVDAAQVDVRAFGETNLPVPTADGVREPANRVTKVMVVREKVAQPAQPQ